MNDWYNDPPDPPEDDDEDQSLQAIPNCDWGLIGCEIVDFTEKDFPPLCPHGNEWGACQRCDYESDLAYDAWREKH